MKSKNKKKDFCIFALPGMFCFFAVVIIPFVYGVHYACSTEYWTLCRT